MTFHGPVKLRNRQYLKHSISSFRKHRRFPALNHITIFMSILDWPSIGLSDSRTDSVCRTQEPEKVPSTKIQYDIDGCFDVLMNRNHWAQELERIPRNESHYDIDECIGMTFPLSVRLRNRQGFKHSISWFRKQREFPALNHITIWISMSEWLSIHLSDSGTAKVSRTPSAGSGIGKAFQH